ASSLKKFGSFGRLMKKPERSASCSCSVLVPHFIAPMIAKSGSLTGDSSPPGVPELAVHGVWRLRAQSLSQPGDGAARVPEQVGRQPAERSEVLPEVARARCVVVAGETLPRGVQALHRRRLAAQVHDPRPGLLPDFEARAPSRETVVRVLEIHEVA